MTSWALLLLLAMDHSDTVSRSPMERLLPPSMEEWAPTEPHRIYSGRQIFDYIDGAGEVYLAYHFNSVLVQRYARPGQEEILVEIFDMATPQNAFGVYSYIQGRGAVVPIGQEGEYKNGLLCFWRERYCVYLRIDRESKEANEAVLAMGKWIAAAIGRDGEKPGILQFLPDGAYRPGSLRYLYRHEILNTHFYVADGNLFLLSDSTEAVLVRMNLDGSHVLLVAYPSDVQADAAYRNILSRLIPDATEAGVVRTENGKWTGCRVYGRYVTAVFDAAEEENAVNALTSILARLP